MCSLSSDVLVDMLSYHKKQKQLVLSYIEKNNLEMAYLAEWTILEYFVKKISSNYRRVKLKKLLSEWINYLENNDEKPSEIKSFTIDSITLPHEKDLKDALNYYNFDSNKVWSIMSSSGNYRRYRNRLAHNGEMISESTFNKMYPELESLVGYFVSCLV